MRTNPVNAFAGPIVSTKQGRSGGPVRGAQARGAPSAPATDVNVPHSCVTRSDAAKLTAERISVVANFIGHLQLMFSGTIRPRLPWRHEGKTSKIRGEIRSA